MIYNRFLFNLFRKFKILKKTVTLNFTVNKKYHYIDFNNNLNPANYNFFKDKPFITLNSIFRFIKIYDIFYNGIYKANLKKDVYTKNIFFYNYMHTLKILFFKNMSLNFLKKNTFFLGKSKKNNIKRFKLPFNLNVFFKKSKHFDFSKKIFIKSNFYFNSLELFFFRRSELIRFGKQFNAVYNNSNINFYLNLKKIDKKLEGFNCFKFFNNKTIIYYKLIKEKFIKKFKSRYKKTKIKVKSLSSKNLKSLFFRKYIFIKNKPFIFNYKQKYFFLYIVLKTNKIEKIFFNKKIKKKVNSVIKINYYKKDLKKSIINLLHLHDNYVLDNNLYRFDSKLLGRLTNSFLIRNLEFANDSNIEDNYKFNSLNRKFLKKQKKYYYNNYYPVNFLNSISLKRYMYKFKLNYNISYFNYSKYLLISFMENLFHKKIYLKVTNNFFKVYKHKNWLNNIMNDYRGYQPFYMKKYLILDFIEIVWYSFYLKDLKLMTTWISRYMESVHFKYHKKFIMFFNNFITKHAGVFINILGVKGFFFDIRGKVGVAGNSKKRHLFFKMGTLYKSTKKYKINYNQSLVRTPSGVMGLTYIISY